ncbi:MAG: ribose-phosphate pyrophosphokinase [Planctomycetota bacterium]|nr:MAG: ribose-phosphate pyrophosphokinase [Planctomycetota bacterium]
MKDELIVFSGSAHPALTGEICRELGVEPGRINIHTFSNDNIKVKILENVRESDVFVVQPSAPPVNKGLMELLITIDALKQASAGRITAVTPLYPYARSDKKDEPRISITARLVADLLMAAGADRVLTMNLHAPQIAGFFRIPVDQLDARPLLTNHFERIRSERFAVVAPDAGATKWVSRIAGRLRAPLAIFDKRRAADDENAQVEHLIGDVSGRDVLVMDDEILSGGSMVSVVNALKRSGAKNVYVGCVHPLFSGDATDRLSKVGIKELAVTNTIPIAGEKMRPFITVLSVGPLFAQAIKRIHVGDSVSKLFED